MIKMRLVGERTQNGKQVVSENNARSGDKAVDQQSEFRCDIITQRGGKLFQQFCPEGFAVFARKLFVGIDETVHSAADIDFTLFQTQTLHM